MVVLVIFLKANEARLVTLIGTRESHYVLAPEINKLSLPKNPSQDDVDSFSRAFRVYCADNNVNKVTINRRVTTGQGAGGAGTFLIEGVLLAVSPAPIEFFHPVTVRATEKREGNKKILKPKTVDLGKAYDFGFQGLS